MASLCPLQVSGTFFRPQGFGGVFDEGEVVPSAEVEDGLQFGALTVEVDGGDEGEVGDDDFVARFDPGQDEGQMKPGGSRLEGDGAASPDQPGELVFERVQFRPDGRQPPALDGPAQKLDLEA